MNVDFVEWLQTELDQRGWSQNELIRQVRASGHKLTSSQLSRLMKRDQAGTAEVIIGIADGLKLPRELVFRMRGWLLTEAQETFPPGAEPSLIELDQRVKSWPSHLRETFLSAIMAQANAIDMATEKVERHRQR